jgi:peptidoglycan hydrolase-like protein with peptidoglycan-binding domain
MRLGLAALVVVLAGAAAADDRALVVANQNYADAEDLAGAADVAAAAPFLTAAGFLTVSGSDLASRDLRARLSLLLQSVGPRDRVVILLAGHFAQSDSETWFLGTEAAVPDLATVGAVGIGLGTVLEIAGRAPGGAVVILGTEEGDIALGKLLRPGIGALEIPQGVAVLAGDAAAVADFAARVLPNRGVSLAEMVDQVRSIAAQGFLPADLPFRPATVAAPAPVEPAQTDAEKAEEDRIWAEAKRRGLPQAFDDYLLRYPTGRYAALAKAEAARLRADPAVQARLSEEALALNRDQRRAVQRQLRLLGFDPKGIDGLFGPGSRAAIAAWQQRNSETVTGFLNRDQILRLAAQADRRAAELEAEAEAKRAEQERLDRLYWDQTGAAGDEAGLRAYLKRYPDGLFAELATERLAVFEAERRAEAAAADRAAWDRAVSADTVEGYRDYLASQRQGAFIAEAQARIEALSADAAEAEAEDRAEAEAREQQLALSDLARNLIETRLAALEFEPGPVDGVFDEDTRRAIRRFQEVREMPQTGYLDEESMVALLAGGVLQLGE